MPVRSFQVPAAPGTFAWPPSRPSTPTSRATLVTWSAKVASVSVMLLIVSASAATSPLACTVRLLGQVAVGDCGDDFHDAADLLGEVGGHEVDVVGEVLPGAPNAGHLRLASELAFGADLAGHAGHLASEGVELIDHRVDGVLQLQDFALHIDGDLAVEIAARDRGGHFRDVADLSGEVGTHRVDRVGEILPGPCHARTTAWTPSGLRSDFAGYAGHFRGKGTELLDHRVDGFLELQDLAADVDGDLLGEVAIATAMVTSAMFRTWPVRFEAMELTLSVRSFQVPPRREPAPAHPACPRSRPRGRLASLPKRMRRADRPSCSSFP